VPVEMSIFDTAFAQRDVGLASAMSVVLVLVVGVITFIQFHYLQGDGD
jgi:ABC-type sugar transport system permease subunit